MKLLTSTQRCDDLASKLREVRSELDDLQEASVVVKSNIDPILKKIEDMKFIK
jgi:hypothetical protein